MIINVKLDRATVPIERQVFESLFEQSVVCDRAPVHRALREGAMPYRTLVNLAREAEIPYPLFFAPTDVVEE